MAAKVRRLRDAWWVVTHYEGKRKKKRVGTTKRHKREAEEIAKKINAALALGTISGLFYCFSLYSGTLRRKFALTQAELDWIATISFWTATYSFSAATYSLLLSAFVCMVVHPCALVRTRALGRAG